MRMFTAALTIAALALILAASSGAKSEGPVQLTGTVGPGFTITLKNHARTVRMLAPATYSFAINDKSEIHNFHLSGPGIDKKTTVAFVGTRHWTLTLRAGTYTYLCDPHATGMGGHQMRGQFVVRAP
ncbi:MAG: hypothetical protein H0X39_15520 [Actinobacteria bacterium]|nr:hypothetical protein [Actinomycetota bacterium]